ncbi:hypothetical protein D0T50_12355 [Bacteroides sp. 214]|uniref:hypothetical protein n=1 Tax=Bacteroides sp. 214 TaxID=2302935 RepID=UPI0013D46452|nr:hypothetical protein [Bacteroides sp. 214]NDW13676.1 hypothetical protein [Bacteroides sp. 214]
MVRNFLLITALFLISSCGNNPRKSSLYEQDFCLYKLTNDALVNEIELFYDSVIIPHSHKRDLFIQVTHYNDTTIYNLFHFKRAPISGSLILYAKVREEVVAFCFLQNREIAFSKELLWSYFSERYPEEYDHYQKYNVSPVPGGLGKSEYWVLTFVGGNFIERRILY